MASTIDINTEALMTCEGFRCDIEPRLPGGRWDGQTPLTELFAEVTELSLREQSHWSTEPLELLAYFPNVRVLTLALFRTPDQYKGVAKHFPHLEVLEVNTLNIAGVAKEILNEARQLPKLKELRLAGAQVSPEDFPSLSLLSQLEVLDISGWNTRRRPFPVVDLTSALRQLRNLRVLNVSHIHELDARVLCAVKHLHALEELRFDGTKITATDATAQLLKPRFGSDPLPNLHRISYTEAEEATGCLGLHRDSQATQRLLKVDKLAVIIADGEALRGRGAEILSDQFQERLKQRHKDIGWLGYRAPLLQEIFDEEKEAPTLPKEFTGARFFRAAQDLIHYVDHHGNGEVRDEIIDAEISHSSHEWECLVTRNEEEVLDEIAFELRTVTLGFGESLDSPVRWTKACTIIAIPCDGPFRWIEVDFDRFRQRAYNPFVSLQQFIQQLDIFAPALIQLREDVLKGVPEDAGAGQVFVRQGLLGVRCEVSEDGEILRVS